MKKFLYLLLFVPVLVTQAQQLNLTNMYYYNTYLVNPAVAGENGCFNAFLGHRSQWTAMQDRPVNNWLTIALERAQDIADAIKAAGISSERIKTHSNGEATPLNGNNTNEERLQNRRVQVRFTY